MAPREPLPRGPVTYAEEQTAQLIGEVRETNRLLGLLLAQGQAAPGPAAAIQLPQEEPPTEEESTVLDDVAESRPVDPGLLQSAALFDREVKPRDRPGAAPRKRPGRN